MNGLPETLNRIEKINVQGGTLPAMEGEETLDAQWTSGIAPDAKVRIYACGSLSFVDLDLALDQIIADLASEPGMRQLSISLGLGETFLGSADGEVTTENQKFLTLSAAGVNVFVSTGDAGSNPDDTGHSSDGTLQAEFQSTSPFVVAVGGTRLSLNPAGAVAEETGWVDSGGGKSIFFSRPPWQTGTGVPTGTERLVPDVSLVADPDTGALIILQGETQQIGGTSWSAPTWAAFCALMNEARHESREAAAPIPQPVDLPGHEQRLVSRYHDREQWRLQRRNRLRPGDGDRRARPQGPDRRAEIQVSQRQRGSVAEAGHHVGSRLRTFFYTKSCIELKHSALGKLASGSPFRKASIKIHGLAGLLARPAGIRAGSFVNAVPDGPVQPVKAGASLWLQSSSRVFSSQNRSSRFMAVPAGFRSSSGMLLGTAR